MAQAPNITYYDILNITPAATAAEVKKAYLKIAKTDHPDLNGGESSPRYLAAQEAMSVLSDASSRATYDISVGIHTKSAPDPVPGAQTRPRPNPRRRNGPPPKAPNYGQNWNENQSRKYAAPLPLIDMDDVTMPSGPQRFSPPLGRTFGGKYEVPVAMRLRQLANILIGPVTFIGAILSVYLAATHEDWSALFLPAATMITPWAAFVATFRIDRILPYILLAVVTALAILFNPIDLLGFMTVWLGVFFAWVSAPLLGRWKNTRVVDDKTAVFDIFGTPGNRLEEVFGDRGGYGSVGEHRSADLLQLLTRFPGAKIFHGLRFDVDSEADVDHAVIYGDKVALIDSKMWAPGHVRVAPTPGSPETMFSPSVGQGQIRPIRMNAAAANYQKILPGYEIRPWVLIHSTDEGAGHTWDNNASNGMVVGDAQFVISDIAKWFAASGPHAPAVDRELMGRIMAMVIA
ncbi:hypothetical protein GCM10009689_18490 [Brevibacterium antiquum]|uniref:J domain-containing protein n=1 Tax=Brevibacterium antiquum TaxID=234835 RepID=UPI0018DF66E3|nr:DnaJ domain-containing protein [Brevibacterium antiquum]